MSTAETFDDLVFVRPEAAVHAAVNASVLLQIGHGGRVAGNDAGRRRRFGKSGASDGRSSSSDRRFHLPVISRPDIGNESESVLLGDGRRVSAEVRQWRHRGVRERRRHRRNNSVIDIQRSVFGKRDSGRFRSRRSSRFDSGSGCVQSTWVCDGIVDVDGFAVEVLKVVGIVVVVVVVVVVAVSAVKRSAFGHHFIRVVAGPDPIHPLRVKIQLTQ